MVIELDNTEFDSKVLSDELNVVLFQRDTCGPCRVTKPQYQMASQYFDKHDLNVKFYMMNTSEESNRPLIDSLGIRGVPSVLYFRNGQEINRKSGFQSATQITDEIFKILENIKESTGDVL